MYHCTTTAHQDVLVNEQELLHSMKYYSLLNGTPGVLRIKNSTVDACIEHYEEQCL